ncbi:endo-1,31,4-beta-D-glucanase-like [Heracleum sosnowskyi]|uniref:Endo-1,31,4-beta-D-glucanase-like n=1 Tax=Heracleum sosnowskyi TaxID=360622 RepID=A0AAD8LXY2_9APIA|nr:endo-1,31,4-beta-D-glucanase-like [Heracleum sosnowskyi]
MAGSQCCSNPPVLMSNTGQGNVQEIAGLKVYVAAASSSSKHGILLVSDVFGYEAPKLRKLADKIAAAGFHVVVPDFFRGDPFSYDNPEKPLPVWRSFHSGEEEFEDAKAIINALKSDGISNIGAAGFCWGAKVVVQLASSDCIQAAVMLHPSFITQDDMKEVKVPIAILGAEIDKYCPPEVLKQFGETLSAKPEVISFVKKFPGTVHGWTVRYNDNDENAVKSAEESHEDMLTWFNKYVK